MADKTSAPLRQEEEEEEDDNDNEASLQQLKRSEEMDLRRAAAEASVVEFDDRTGLPLKHAHFLPDGMFDPIRGLVKKRLPLDLFQQLTAIHNHIQQRVHPNYRVPWSGLNDGDTKVRAFGFMGQEALDRLDAARVRLAAPEKDGQDAIDDEVANRKAICILHDKENDLDIGNITDQLVDTLNPSVSGLDPDTVATNNLVAYQINLHNGCRYLPAHLDWPLHEGFGRVIVTVAIRGNATVLLIAGDTIMVGGEELQPAWRFHLQEGECYVLSDRARNRCLHAVVADDGNCMRESLNLRFGLHTEKEAKEDITQYWEDAL
jgi:hypothetical protein